MTTYAVRYIKNDGYKTRGTLTYTEAHHAAEGYELMVNNRTVAKVGLYVLEDGRRNGSRLLWGEEIA